MDNENTLDRYTVSEDGKVGPIDSFKLPRFAGPATFARLPRMDEVDSYDIAVVGVPFDAGTSYRPGARFGPSAIREGSRLLRPYNFSQEASPFSLVQVVDAGDIGVNPFNITAAVKSIEEGISHLYKHGKSVVTLGGDHTISLPILRAVNKLHGPVALIHFDAHLDTWDTYFGEPCTHGTPFRRATEEGLLVKESSVHIGLRGPLYDRQDLLDDVALGFTAITAASVPEIGTAGVIERIKKRVGNAPVYVSIDVDVMDPAFTPGTGTPEAGGLSSREMLAILRGFGSLNIVGADVVEVAPAYDHAEITSIAAAHMAYELITLLALQHKS
jgi:agmatinase